MNVVPFIPLSFPHLFSNNNLSVLTLMSIEKAHFYNNTKFLLQKANLNTPSAIFTQIFPDLRQKNLKMRSTTKLDEIGCIYLNFAQTQVTNKIKKKAFSGGAATTEELKERGTIMEVDVPWNYMTWLLEDDGQLEQYRVSYSKADILTSDFKKIVSDLLA